MSNNRKAGNVWCPEFPVGDACNLHGWEAVLPDPEMPGVFRLVRFSIVARMEMLNGSVDAAGNPIGKAARPAKRKTKR